MVNPRTSCNCRHGTAWEIGPGTILHTHPGPPWSDDPHGRTPNAQFDRWIITALHVDGLLMAKWIPGSSEAPPGPSEGSLRPSEIEGRLASDNIRIEVTA